MRRTGTVHPLPVVPMAPSKKNPKGSCGVYVLSPSCTGQWRVLLHRRSYGVDNAQGRIAAPGGMIEAGDEVDDSGRVDKAGAHKRAACRELQEEAGITIDDFGSDDFYELAYMRYATSQHKNFVLLLKGPLAHAAPDEKHAWECVHGGMETLTVGEAVPGDYYAWVDVEQSLKLAELWQLCKDVLTYIDETTRRTPASTATNPVSARVGSVNACEGASSATSSELAKNNPTLAADDPANLLPRMIGRVKDHFAVATNFRYSAPGPPSRAKPFDVLRKHRTRCRAYSPLC